MTRFSFSSLRARLMLLVLLAVIPALGLILYTAAEQRRSAAVEAQEGALRLARLASSDQEQLIEGARQLLISLAQLPHVRQRDSGACNALFANLLKQYPLYATLGAVDAKGYPFCSAIPIRRPFSAADRAWFQRAVQTRGFAIGDYQIGRVSGKASLNFGYPLLDDRGVVQAVVLVGLDLAWLNRLAAKAQLPEGSVLTMTDQNGTILARDPDPEKWVGKSMSEVPIVRAILNRRAEGTASVAGVDGIPRLYAFTPVRGTTQAGEVYVSVGIPHKVAFADADRILKRNLAGLGIVAALTLTAAWFGADLFILRRVNILIRATRRLSAGDLSARTGSSYGQGELGQLARAFDEMADALQIGEAARRAAESRFANILNIAADAVIAVDESQRIVLFNKRAEQIFGYSAGEVLGRPLDLLLPSRFVVAHRQHIHAFAAASETVRPMDERREVFGQRRDGTEFPAEASISQLTEDGQTIFTVILRDITERKLAEQRIKALHGINLAAASTLDLRAVLDILLEKIDLLLPYSIATVRLFNKENGLLEPIACRNLDEKEWKAERWRGGRGLANVVFETRTPTIIGNAQTDPRVRDREFYRKHELVSYLGVPLITKGEALGVLNFYTKREHEFSNEEVEFLSTLARQAAIAIHNSQLYERTKGQAVELERANEDLKRREEIQTLLKELSQDITSLDIDSLLKGLTEKVREVFKVDVSDVRVNEKGAWKIMGVSGIEPERLQSGSTGTARGRSGWIIENRRALLIPDIAQQAGLPAGEALSRIGLRGYLGVPLFSRGGEVIGVLRALSYEPRDFTQEEVDLLQQLANGAAIALENARLLEQTKKQAVELAKASKVKDEFLGFVSHELRTPVNAVLGYTGMIQDGMFGEINPEQEKILAKVLNNSNELLSMINSLLEASRIGAGAVKMERDEVRLCSFLDELRSAYDVPLKKELTLVWDYPSVLPVVITDREKLRHILQNLVNNAIKFTEKGSVTISARLTPHALGMEVEFKVADTGIGIAEDEMPFIFDMFRQVEDPQRRSGGVGLGLHIVKKFTELLGGKIDVESEPGKGSTFTVRFPTHSRSF